MDSSVAAAVVASAREEAQQAARDDLRVLRRHAVEYGRERSRQIAKTTIINRQTGELRYNPAGRLLRDWYVHVYLNTLRRSLGEPAITIDAQEVEDLTRLLHRVQPRTNALQALKAVAVMRDIAVDEAAQATVRIVEHVGQRAIQRAITHSPDNRFDGDELRVHVARHWYQRCYDDQVERATQTQRPLTAVTSAEERQVARSMETGVARRLVGEDGVPLMTAHHTLLSDVDRRLAIGDVGVQPAGLGGVAAPEAGFETLRERVLNDWGGLSPKQRHQRLIGEGVALPSEAADWDMLRNDEQRAALHYYLAVNRRELLDQPFDSPALVGRPSEVAAAMFGHTHPADGYETDGKAEDPLVAMGSSLAEDRSMSRHMS